MDKKLGDILKTSGKMFLNYGIRSVSMDDICREMSISKKTLYQYVENKADIIEKILNYHLNDIERPLIKIEKNNNNAIDVLLNVSTNISESMRKYKPSIIFELKKYYSEMFNKFANKKREQTFLDVKRNIMRGIKEGIYRENLNVELTSRLYIQRLESLNSGALFENEDFTFEDIFEVMFENHIRGIANKKGVEYFEKKIKEIKNNEKNKN